MIELRPHFPLSGLLRTAGLPRSSFYYQQKALKTIDKHCDLKTKIREIFDRHRGRYGYRRITAELKRTGLGRQPQDGSKADERDAAEIAGST